MIRVQPGPGLVTRIRVQSRQLTLLAHALLLPRAVLRPECQTQYTTQSAPKSLDLMTQTVLLTSSKLQQWGRVIWVLFGSMTLERL